MSPIATILAAITIGLLAFFMIKKLFNHFKKWIKKGGKL
jgi:hypothetical protein